jgi:hypothetical protein
MSDVALHRELLNKLYEFGMIGYGQSISGQFVRNVIGVTMPELGTRADFDRVVLKELSAIDFVRSQLIDRGMYLAREGQDYRILTPSENLVQVDHYIKAAGRKMNRARKLQEATPSTNRVHDNKGARIFMHGESHRPRPSAA